MERAVWRSTPEAGHCPLSRSGPSPPAPRPGLGLSARRARGVGLLGKRRFLEVLVSPVRTAAAVARPEHRECGRRASPSRGRPLLFALTLSLTASWFRGVHRFAQERGVVASAF